MADKIEMPSGYPSGFCTHLGPRDPPHPTGLGIPLGIPYYNTSCCSLPEGSKCW